MGTSKLGNTCGIVERKHHCTINRSFIPTGVESQILSQLQADPKIVFQLGFDTSVAMDKPKIISFGISAIKILAHTKIRPDL